MPEIKLTRKELLELNAGYKAVGNLPGLQFAYTVARNMDLIDSEIRAIRKAAKFDEDYNEYDKERAALAEKHAVKENGSPKTQRGENGVPSYVISDMEAFNKEFEALKKKHKKAIDARDEQEKKLNEFLEKEVTVTQYILKFEDLPTNVTPDQLNAISRVIDKSGPANASKSKK